MKSAPFGLSLLSLTCTALFMAGQSASAVVIAGYNLSAGSVTNSNSTTLANPTSAANTAALQPGAAPSALTIVGAQEGGVPISISGGTNSAYIQGSNTPTEPNIYTGAKYFTFSLNLTSSYNLTSLTFDMAATNSTASAAAIVFGAQINTGSGFTNLTTGSISAPAGTGTTTNFGVYTANLSSYTNLTGTVTFRLFAADDVNDDGVAARIRNIQLNAAPVPEPSTALSLSAGLASLVLVRRRGR